MKSPNQLLFAAALIALVACERNTERPATPELRSSEGIVNGLITSDFPSVVRIESADGSCTATAVSDSTIITARHCLDDSPNGGVTYGSGFFGGTRAIAALASPDVDMAVVVFPNRTFRSWSAVATKAPVIGERVIIVGFGQTDFMNDNEVDGHKRKGRNKLVGFADKAGQVITHRADGGDYLHYRSPIVIRREAGVETMTGRGDSGGPVFIADKVAGVVSFGGTLAQMTYVMLQDPNPSTTSIYGFDVNVTGPKARQLLKNARNEIGARINGL